MAFAECRVLPRVEHMLKNFLPSAFFMPSVWPSAKSVLCEHNVDLSLVVRVDDE
jgi:hypothetical protein